MSHEEYIEMGLEGNAPLKIILRGSVDGGQGEKIGVVSVVFATVDKSRAKNRLYELTAADKGRKDYYMVYSVPLDIDLTGLEHYPSIAVSRKDLD